MGVKLRSGVAIDGTGSIVLELGHDEVASCFGCVVAADPRLSVTLQPTKSDRDSSSRALPDPLITADESGQRDGLRRRKSSIPSRPMLDCVGCRAVGVRIFL